MYSELEPDKLILRDWLAKDRTVLANERTLLAYVRTSLMLGITGGTLIKFLGGDFRYVLAGYCLVAIGALVGLVGVARFFALKKQLDRLSADRDAGPAPEGRAES